MTARLDRVAAVPELMKTWLGTSIAIASGLEPTLAELVELRASQINGCAYWLDMHTKDAWKDGESEQRLYALDAWRERLSTQRGSKLPWPGQKRSR